VGFGLRVFPNGRKDYVVKCRIKGRQRFITLGPHGPVTAEQARAKAYCPTSSPMGQIEVIV
jgi:hypothetical protein